MAVVHLGCLRGDAGFVRVVAIKRLHRQYVGDPEFTALLLDEARLTSHLQHPNVVAPKDLVRAQGELFVVMEYVHGLTLAALVREARARGEAVPLPIVARIVSDVLTGLHAAHNATDGRGRPLALVHRDVSPQNVMVGAEGLARVLDFGIAQAAFRSQTTREGQLRAKLAYAAPEHVLDRTVDRRADVYSTAVVCWELITLQRLFSASNESALLARVLEQPAQPASNFRSEVPRDLDALLLSALSKDPAVRPTTAEEFSLALERIAPPAMHREVARWVVSLGGASLERLAARLAEVEAGGATNESPMTLGPPISTRTGQPAVADVGAKSTRPLKPGRTMRRPIVVVGVALTAAAVAVTPSLLGRPPPGLSVSAAGSPSATGAPMPRELPEAPVGLPPPEMHEPPAPLPDPPPQLPARTTPPAQTRSATAAPAVRPAAKRHQAPAADECAELTTEVDAQGIRRVKRQCLR
jgi:serine/threonine-protein kinase